MDSGRYERIEAAEQPSLRRLVPTKIRGVIFEVFKQVRQEYGPILFLGSSYVGLAYLVQFGYFHRPPEIWPVPVWALPIFLYGISFLICIYAILTVKMWLLGTARMKCRLRSISLGRATGNILTLFLVVHFLYAFSIFKILIPAVHPFSWDETFMQLDQIIHFGNHPWTLIQPIIGFPLITQALDLLYTLWFYVLFIFLIWMAFSLEIRLRTQFFITFFLVWIILGTVAATLFSSGGPCYFYRITGISGPFRHLMGYLEGVGYSMSTPLLALRNQDLLWSWHSQEAMPGFGRGISAMPSIHVATSVLFALTGWHANRLLGVLLWGYALTILVGSVHLGWHYAIDGYIAVLTTLALWRGVRLYLNYERMNFSENL